MKSSNVIDLVFPLGAHSIHAELNDIARQASGSAFTRYEENVVIATACVDTTNLRTESFLPLICDYRENTFAAGRFPGGFFKREGRPSEKEILTSRLIDRSLRPLFPKKGYTFDTQVITSVYSASRIYDTDVTALNAAALAILFSPIPVTEAVVGVRIAEVEEQFVVNPSYEQLKTSPLNLIVAGTRHGIVMVEAGAQEYPEDRMAEALLFGQEVIRAVAEHLMEVYEEHRISEMKIKVEPTPIPEEILSSITEAYAQRLREALEVPGKLAYQQAVRTIEEEAIAVIPDEDQDRIRWTREALNELKAKIVRNMILVEHKRTDGRSYTEIRPIDVRVGVLPRTHGSALFTRGETKALATSTLGTSEDAQKVEMYEGETFKRFMLHYNFPPFSVGEVSPLRSPARREIGHGALAERALLPVIPDEEAFPYTIRVVSDILESNGSSSMATVCSGCLALMDAGVPIRSPVAGIAMGLFQDDSGRYAILTDIAGEEDHTGDMDFKVAGSRQGLTALQMDIKISSLSAAILKEALYQAREARLKILDRMAEVLPQPRPEISPYAPRLIITQVPVDKIATLIGPGGKMVKSIIEKTGVKIDIQDDGKVVIAGESKQVCEEALKLVEEVTAEVEIGKVYLGKVTRLAEFGAFVEILPGVIGLLHISEMAPYNVRNIRDIVKEEGQEILVRVLEVDGNRIRLSHKEFAPAPAESSSQNPYPRERVSRPPNHHGRDRRGSRRPPRFRDPRGDRNR